MIDDVLVAGGKEAVSVEERGVAVGEHERFAPLEVVHPNTVWVELQKILPSIFGLFAVCTVLWLALYLLSQRFPYVMVGSAAVYNAKESAIDDATLLNGSKRRRILIFGNSKILSGFIPNRFDSIVPECSSYNLGLPATGHFMPELETLLARGERPTHILVTVPWTDPPAHQNSVFHFPNDDAAILKSVFPFRTWVHDSFILLYRSPQFGGVRKAYIQAQQSITKMNDDRGYYFIAGESHFANDELPDDFQLDSDRPQTVERRDVNTTLASFHRLSDLAQEYNFVVLMVPSYRRPGEFAPVSGVNDAAVEALRPFHQFKALGPDYYIFDRHNFSDLLHLNLKGAQQYTDTLAHLVANELETNE